MRTVLIVDAANVMGSRPDGWWRDRLGAARRLRDSLAGLGPVPVEGETVAAEVVLVVEGAARSLEPAEGVRVVAAPGSGDDEIVAQVGASGEARYLVVTADRALRARCEAAGARVAGPRWLLDLLG